ncbi:MAG: hypothetical protein DRI90_22625 [Deltaproteobacteria bacterium]|nr:MAG: hypothetical protein DRI90_22625 [Deltaproteobacteria bacterium]
MPPSAAPCPPAPPVPPATVSESLQAHPQRTMAAANQPMARLMKAPLLMQPGMLPDGIHPVSAHRHGSGLDGHGDPTVTRHCDVQPCSELQLQRLLGILLRCR